jgi:hypothetical protein
MAETNTGILLYMSIDNFITDFVKGKNVNEYQLIVVTREAVTDIKRHAGTFVGYESKYNNVDFVPSLIPSGAILQSAYGNNPDRFYSDYESQLLSDDIFIDICCIIDMVVNDGLNVILLSNDADFKSGFPTILVDFIKDKFKINLYMYEELIDDPEIDVTNLGNIGEIKETLTFHIMSLMPNKDMDEFVNKLTEDVIDVYKRQLALISDENLKKMSDKYGLKMGRRATREQLEEAILNHVLSNSKNE